MSKGLYTNSELLDSIIIDLNNTIKEFLDGQYIQVCYNITSISQKLVNLRQTIDNDLKNRDQTIETLKNELRMAGHEVIDVAPDKLHEHLQEIGKSVDSGT